MLINQRLEGSWHTVSAKTRQTIKDVGILKQLLYYLLSYDCVSFNTFLETILASNTIDSKSFFKIENGPSGWLMLDAADLLFDTARSRVYKKNATTKKIEPVLEEQPKFKALVQSLLEIQETQKEDENGICCNSVLIMAYGHRSRRELEQLVATHLDPSPPYSCAGSKNMMHTSFANYLHWKKTMLVSSDAVTSIKQSSRNQPFAKRRKVRKAADITETLDAFDLDEAFLATFVTPDEPEEPSKSTSNIHVHSYSSPQFGAYSDTGDDYLLLRDLKPKWVIMYDANPTFVRCLEVTPNNQVFKAQNPDHQLQVYFMVYDDSVEEQIYLSSIRREKNAFERLISAKTVPSLIRHSLYH
jgi:DNA excision repair protein ERCC-4